jgi:hypothetical protein
MSFCSWVRVVVGCGCGASVLPCLARFMPWERISVRLSTNCLSVSLSVSNLSNFAFGNAQKKIIDQNHKKCLQEVKEG